MDYYTIINTIDKVKKTSTEKDCLEALYILKVIQLKYNYKLEQLERYRLKDNEVINFLTFCKNIDKNRKLDYDLLEEYISSVVLNKKALDALLSIISIDSELPSISDAFKKYSPDSHTIVSNQIIKLALQLFSQPKEIYVPISFGLRISELTDAVISCEYENKYSEFLKYLITNIEKKVINLRITNSLENPKFIINDTLKQFDGVLGFPPFSEKKDLDINAYKYNRFNIHKGVVLDVAYFEHIMSQTKDIAVILMPVGFTFRSGIEEEFRKYLIENNLLKAIIQLPPNLYSATAIETTFFIIDKNKNTDSVYFMNLKDNNFLIKKGRQTILKDIKYISDNFHKQTTNDFGIVVSNEEIKSQEYNLAIDRYILSNELIEIESKLSFYEVTPLEKISLIRKSQTLKESDCGKIVYELSPTDFSLSGFTTKGKKTKRIDVNDKKFKMYRLLPYDVLLSVKGVVGKVGIIGENIEYILASQAIQIIRLDTKENAIILYMYLKSSIGQILLKQFIQGTAMPQISTKELKKFKTPILKIEEKNRIIKKFHDEISMYERIDNLKNEIDKINSSFFE